MYWFKRKWFQIKNVFKWLPIIWNQYNFDYNYAIEVLRFQLLKTAEFLESDKAYTLSAKVNAGKIRTFIKLLDLVYDEYYGCEYQTILESKYGKQIFEWEPYKKDSYKLNLKYDKKYTKKQLREIKEEEQILFKESIKKQNKAHRILWKLFEHNIQKWWD